MDTDTHDTPRKIAFVDDDEGVLRGLRRLMMSVDDEWEAEFFQTGREALAALEAGDFDVIVSDMRMPEMDGIELLERVRDAHPGMVRVVLSGHADRALALRSAAVAHQFLAKPCNSEELEETIRRTFQLRESLADEHLLAVASGITTIPSMPALYQQMLEILDSPDGSLHDVGEVVARDPGMTVKMLQLVNSAFFGLRQEIRRPAEAASFLGIEMLRSLVLSIHVFSESSELPVPGRTCEELLQHDLEVAALAREIARAEELAPHRVDDCFLAGVLHDVGLMVMSKDLSSEMRAAWKLASEEAGPGLCEAERRVFGTTHAAIGSYVLGIWGLPTDVVQAVAGHHEPGRFGGSAFLPLTAVHAADALLSEATPGAPDGCVLDERYLEEVGMTARVPVWREIRDQLRSAEAA